MYQIGCKLRCPLIYLDAEISTQEQILLKYIEEIHDYQRNYFESAIRDAHAAGVIHAPEPAAKAHMLFTYYQGVLTEARIRNDLNVFRDVARGTLELLGAVKVQKAA